MGITFDDGLCEIADDTAERDQEAEDPGMNPLEEGEAGDEMGEGDAQERRDQDSSKESFPGFSGRDFGDHFMFTDQFANNVGPDVREFSDGEEIENGHTGIEAFSVHEIDQSDVTEEDGDVEESHESSGLLGDRVRGLSEDQDVATEDCQDHEGQEAEKIEGKERGEVRAIDHEEGDAEEPEESEEQSHFFIDLNSFCLLSEVELPLSPESDEGEDNPVDPRRCPEDQAEGDGPEEEPGDKALSKHVGQSEAKGDLKINLYKNEI